MSYAPHIPLMIVRSSQNRALLHHFSWSASSSKRPFWFNIDYSHIWKGFLNHVPDPLSQCLNPVFCRHFPREKFLVEEGEFTRVEDRSTVCQRRNVKLCGSINFFLYIHSCCRLRLTVEISPSRVDTSEVLSGMAFSPFFASLELEFPLVVPLPAKASQFIKAKGSQPLFFSLSVTWLYGWSRVPTLNSNTLTSPFLFDIFDPSALSRRGRCPNWGGGRLRQA